MSPIAKTASAVSALMLLAGCQNLPPLPAIFTASTACPDLSAGPGAFTPPFPNSCSGMKTSRSGLRWIELAPGATSKGSPNADATVVVSYEGFLAGSGKQIDSSYARGEASVFKLGELTDGMSQALQSMHPGEERLVYIPSELAYGSEARGDLIPANSDLVFRLKLDGYLSAAELEAAAAGPAPSKAPAVATAPSAKPSSAIGVTEALGPDMTAWQTNFPWDTSKPGVNNLPSGVSYLMLERGNSPTRNALRSDSVVIHYEGRLAETSEFFDSSWSRGEPSTFPVSGVIPGFTEVLTYMRPGDRVLVHIPSDMAYGADGAGELIGPGADLMFQINMLAIKPAG